MFIALCHLCISLPCRWVAPANPQKQSTITCMVNRRNLGEGKVCWQSPAARAMKQSHFWVDHSISAEERREAKSIMQDNFQRYHNAAPSLCQLWRKRKSSQKEAVSWWLGEQSCRWVCLAGNMTACPQDHGHIPGCGVGSQLEARARPWASDFVIRHTDGCDNQELCDDLPAGGMVDTQPERLWKQNGSC